jgi:DNA-binding response OmpR family regulator
MAGGTPRIVLVEDDPSMSRAIERILRVGDFTAVTFATAEAALEAGAATADCLILDVRLPGMSGFDLYRLLASGDDRPPAIFITAHDSPGVRETAEGLDAAGYLPKPFSGRALLDAVARALGSP